MSGLTLVLMVWVLVKVPDYPGQSASQRIGLRQVLLTPGVRSVLGVVMTWMLAHNILYTYIAPFVAPAGLGNDVDIVLLVFGLAALGDLADRAPGRSALAQSSAGEPWNIRCDRTGIWFFAQSATVIYAGVLVWGLSFGGAATLLQTALADSAGEGADVALSLNVVVWNSAIAIGALTGGVLLDQIGVGIFPWVLLVLLLAGLWIVFSARNHGFPEGQRQSPDFS